MKIAAKPYSGSNDRVEQEPMAEGTYPARLVQVIHMGTQEQRPFKGQPKPDEDTIMTTYEFLDEFVKDENGEDVEGKPRWLSEDFPFKPVQLEKAKSSIRYKVLDPDNKYDGDWSSVIGAPCMVTVGSYKTREGKVRNKILSTAPMRAKDAKTAPELKNPPKLFSVLAPDMEVLGSLPKWIQDKVNNSPEMKGTPAKKQEKYEGPVEQEDAEDDGEW